MDLIEEISGLAPIPCPTMSSRSDWFFRIIALGPRAEQATPTVDQFGRHPDVVDRQWL